MKFANLCDHASTSINIGDYLQFSVITGLYQRMGIPESAIYFIRGDELKTYRGETLLLPLNFIATILIQDNRLAISDDIIPVFLALSLSNMKEKLDINLFFSDSENIAFFLKYSPIGCRDEYTYHIFQKYNIPSYLSGCLTATLPRRHPSVSQNKVFFVDTPSQLLPYIPKELFSNCKFLSQQAYFSEEELLDYPKVFRFIQHRYACYKNEAKLVVTSRLHVAVPCTAMGIPVIFTKDYIDTRFSWLEKLIPLYSIEQYSNIDWNPVPPDYEEQKEKLISLATCRIRSVFDLYHNIQQINQFYLSRTAIKHYYDSHEITHKNTKYLEQFVNQNWCKDQPINFGLWGITANALFWLHWICDRFPMAKFSMAIDSYKTGEFDGLPITTPSKIKKESDIYIIVIAVSAVPDARALFHKLGWKESHYCIAVDSFITEVPDLTGNIEGE